MLNRDVEALDRPGNATGRRWLRLAAHRDIEQNMLPLITDRSKADVDRLRAMYKRGWDSLTADEKAGWLDGVQRGSIGAEALNRVGIALHSLADWLGEWGYPVRPTARTDWQASDLCYQRDISALLADVEAVRAALAQYQTTPETPERLSDWQEANAAEKILSDIYELLQKMATGLRYCGTFYSGI